MNTAQTYTEKIVKAYADGFNAYMSNPTAIPCRIDTQQHRPIAAPGSSERVVASIHGALNGRPLLPGRNAMYSLTVIDIIARELEELTQ